jgi:menaquinone-dependent protoporphyrinogen oxidase
MEKRVLVGYATRTGSTTGVAEVIAEEIGVRGYTVDLRPLKEKPPIAGYDAVVLGSAVNGAAWLPEAVQFAKSNAAALTAVPTTLFSVHIMNLGDDEKADRKRRAYTDTVRESVSPIAEAFFAGKGPDKAETSLIARWAFKAFGGGGEGDCRDWDAIRGWARKVDIESIR